MKDATGTEINEGDYVLMATNTRRTSMNFGIVEEVGANRLKLRYYRISAKTLGSGWFFDGRRFIVLNPIPYNFYEMQQELEDNEL